jgi:hypothetical protein
LTAGEQRNALYGPARQQLKELVLFFENCGNSKSSIGFSNVRLAYDDVLARLLYFLDVSNFGSVSTEGRISDRFRQKEPFPRWVMARAEFAIDQFSKARDFADQTRFNKASLLSWLMFFSRFESYDPITVQTVQTFLEVSLYDNQPRHLTEAARVFIDRSSLRVTNVSSVVFRDVALCFIYLFALNGQLPDRVDTNLLRQIQARYDAGFTREFEKILTELVDVDAWSRSL